MFNWFTKMFKKKPVVKKAAKPVSRTVESRSFATDRRTDAARNDDFPVIEFEVPYLSKLSFTEDTSTSGGGSFAGAGAFGSWESSCNSSSSYDSSSSCSSSDSGSSSSSD